MTDPQFNGGAPGGMPQGQAPGQPQGQPGAGPYGQPQAGAGYPGPQAPQQPRRPNPFVQFLLRDKAMLGAAIATFVLALFVPISRAFPFLRLEWVDEATITFSGSGKANWDGYGSDGLRLKSFNEFLQQEVSGSEGHRVYLTWIRELFGMENFVVAMVTVLLIVAALMMLLRSARFGAGLALTVSVTYLLFWIAYIVLAMQAIGTYNDENSHDQFGLAAGVWIRLVLFIIIAGVAGFALFRAMNTTGPAPAGPGGPYGGPGPQQGFAGGPYGSPAAAPDAYQGGTYQGGAYQGGTYPGANPSGGYPQQQ